MSAKRIYFHWTGAQTRLLHELATDPDLTWKAIAAHFPGRTPKQCASAYFNTGGHIQRSMSTAGRAARIVLPEAALANTCERAAVLPIAVYHASITAAVFGDPLPGRSALDQRRAK